MLHPEHRKNNGKYHVAVIHRNTKNILSIIFEELNITGEKLKSFRKEPAHLHLHNYVTPRDLSKEIFNRFS